MKEVLIHYGVKGMKWGVRKQYEAAGGGGGGGWGPNSIATGGGPSPLAASMAGNPKKKKSVGRAEAEKMGIKDKQKSAKEKAKIEGEKNAMDYARSVAELGSLGDALNAIVDAGVDPPEELVNKYEKALQDYVDTSSRIYNDYLLADFDVVQRQGKDYVSAALYNDKFDDWYEAMYEVPAVQFQEKK